MTKYYDIDTSVRVNGGITVNGGFTVNGGDINILTANNINMNSGKVFASVFSGGTVQATLISGGSLVGNGSGITNLSSSSMTDVLKLDGSRSMTGSLIMPSGTQIDFRDGGHNIGWQYYDMSNKTLDGIRVAGWQGVEIAKNITGSQKTLGRFFDGDIVLNSQTSISGNTTIYGSLTTTGNINNIDIVGFKSAYDAHNHDTRYYTQAQIDGQMGTKVNNGDTIMNTNPFGGKQLYINSINDAMFRATDRWIVSGNLYKNSDGSFVSTIASSTLYGLFDGNYEAGLTIPSGNYAIININFNGGYYPGYPYGNVYLSHYYTSFSDTAKLRVYCNYTPQGVGWHEVLFSDYVRNTGQLVLTARNDYYNISQMEIEIHALSGNSASITEIDWKLDRPASNEMPVVDKYRANNLYSTLYFMDTNKNANLVLGTDGTITSSTITSSGNINVNGNISVNGNIIISTGTVDGVDISTFKSSYDTHNHDTRYYTQSQSDSKYLGISANAVNSNQLGGLAPSSYFRVDGSTIMTGDINAVNNKIFTKSVSVRGDTVLDETAGSPWYGIGRTNLNFADTTGTQYATQFGGYFGARIITAQNDFRIGTANNANGILFNGNKVWHQGNDGSGSLMDSDLVDGLHGTQFVRNDTSSTVNGEITINNGGATLAIKAGSLDHTYMEFYARTASPSTRSAYLGFPSSGSNSFSISNQVSGNVDLITIGSGIVTINGNKVFHAGNDGAGSGLDADTVDGLNSSQFLRNDLSTQTVLTGFTVSGTAYIGPMNGTGSLQVRTTGGNIGIQLAGDNATELTGVGAYINANGNAKFNSSVEVGSLIMDSTSLVTNLNAEMVNGIKEKYIAKNQSISELGGKGVYTGLQVQAQTVPNMTVLVKSGTAYTDSGMRIIYSDTSLSLSSASTTYDRIDSVYVMGSSASANEGVLSIMIGTPSASPVAPAIPSDSTLLANIYVPKNIGSIQNSNITDMRLWRPVRYTSSSNILTTPILQPLTYSSQLSTAIFDRAIQFPVSTAISVTIPQGSTAYTWTHNANLAKYNVMLSCNSAEPHISWSNKTNNSITVNLDDICITDVIIDITLIATT